MSDRDQAVSGYISSPHGRPRPVLSHNLPGSADTTFANIQLQRELSYKATGIVRRIDDLGRVVIPKEIRRTMRIREGDPLEIYTSREGEVIFKKYSLLGGLEDFAAQFCDALNRTSGFTAAVTDRDAVIAITGAGKRELLGKSLSEALSRVMEERRIYCCQGADQPLPVTDGNDRYTAAVAAPILCEGDVLGLVLFLSAEGQVPGEGEYKLAQTVSAFLGKHMES